MAKSNLETALENLGFNTVEKQNALLRIFSMSGYFCEAQVWQDLLHLNQTSAIDAFRNIFAKFEASHADEHIKFDPELLKKSFESKDTQTVRFWEDYLLYIGQHAFGRTNGVARCEMRSQEWMSANEDAYMVAASEIGLVHKTSPSRESYDVVWIAGASRVAMLKRIMHYKNLTNEGLISTHAAVLAGARQAWVNIDGISPNVLEALEKALEEGVDLDHLNLSMPSGSDEAKLKEGKRYFISLAKKFDIKLDNTTPFIEYTTKDDCPHGFFLKRLYPNYAPEEDERITETTIARDLVNTYFGELGLEVIDTPAKPDGNPPDTASTTFNAANLFLSKVGQDVDNAAEFHVLLIAENPYTTRQKLTAQKRVDIAVQAFNKSHSSNIKIVVDGAGFGTNQGVVTIHSELGALLSELWGAIHPGEVASHLLYSTRDNGLIDVPVPELGAGTDHMECAA